MALTDLAATSPGQLSKGPTCTVCLKLAELSDVEATALRALLSDPGWRYSALSEALADQGHALKSFALARHARGQCQAGEKLRGA